MEKILEELSEVKSVKGVLLVSTDGLVVAAAGDFDNDVDLVAAGICEVFSTSNNTINDQLNIGSVGKIIIEAKTTYSIIYSVTEDTMLLVTSELDANLGILLIETEEAAKKLQEYLA